MSGQKAASTEEHATQENYHLVIDALAEWYGDGKHQPSEESILEEIKCESDPIKVIATALDHYSHLSTFEGVARPIIKWLNVNANPHAIIVIEPDGAVLYSGEKSV